MKYYIASRLENAEAVKRMASRLNEVGWIQTYDWTTHGSVQEKGLERIEQVAQAELIGVREADVVIVLMPGGRGTHVELGAAIAYKKPVILFAEDGQLLQDGRTCAFYHHPQVITTGLIYDYFKACIG